MAQEQPALSNHGMDRPNPAYALHERCSCVATILIGSRLILLGSPCVSRSVRRRLSPNHRVVLCTSALSRRVFRCVTIRPCLVHLRLLVKSYELH
jgi:hypothetical protein